ncbi:hypothetical protein EV361DRAFT_769605, partial [Lentinula raphanica]
QILFKIINSLTQLLPKWIKHLTNKGFEPKKLMWDVATQWNSTHDMLKSFLEMKTAVMNFVDHSSIGLSEYILTNEEWEVVDGLVSALKLLKDATLFFSTNRASLASVIPAMDTIDKAFASDILDEQTFSKPICHTLAIGKKTLKFYSLSDDSDLY